MSLASPSIVQLPKDAKKPEGVKQTDWDLLLNVGLPKKMIINPDESDRQHYLSFEHLSRGLVEVPPILIQCRWPPKDAKKWRGYWVLGEFHYEGGADPLWLLNGATGAVASVIVDADEPRPCPVNSNLEALASSMNAWRNWGVEGPKDVESLKAALEKIDALAWKANSEWIGVFEMIEDIEGVAFE